MKTVIMKRLGLSASRLGFGCASLGSRVDPARGRRALDVAADAGVTWFDVAPSYGDGAAEEILGTFLKGRDRVFVCSKVGFQPAVQPVALRLARSGLRPLVSVWPSLRRFARLRRSASRLPLSGAAIRSSVIASLQRMSRSHLDMLALHEPQPSETLRDDVLETLSRLKAEGLIRAVALAPATGDDLTPVVEEVFDVLQAPLNAFDNSIPPRFAALNVERDLITHSALAAPGGVAELARLLVIDEGLSRWATNLGYAAAPERAAIEMLVDFALVANPAGIVLMSMFKPNHMQANLLRVERTPPEDILNLTCRLRAVRG